MAIGDVHETLIVRVFVGAQLEQLAVPVGDRYTGEVAVTGCTVRTPRREVPWDDAVAFLRAVPGVRCEPSPYSILNTVEKARTMCAEVPGLRLTLDTGHVTTWGGDVIELLDLAAHVQLRQARKGVPQVISLYSAEAQVSRA